MAAGSVEEFVREFAAALERRDDAACARLWGRASTVLADRFETVADDPEELRPFLAAAWPVYDFLAVGTVDARIVERVELTAAMTRVSVRYSFRDTAGEHLVDGDFEYVLRREGGAVLCHVGVNISAEPNLVGLAVERGYRTSS